MNWHLKDRKKMSPLPQMLAQFIFSGTAIILLYPHSAQAELWKCMTRGAQTATYTDTPVFSDEKFCEKVEAIRFTKVDRAPEARKKESAPPASVKQEARKKKKKERPKY